MHLSGLSCYLRRKKCAFLFLTSIDGGGVGEVTDQFHQEARRDGVFAGVTSGLTAGEQDPSPYPQGHQWSNNKFLSFLALLGQKLMGFNRNTTLFCGIGKFKLVRRMAFSIVTPPLPETYNQLLTDNSN